MYGAALLASIPPGAGPGGAKPTITADAAKGDLAKQLVDQGLHSSE
jgi:hypothetical protein